MAAKKGLTMEILAEKGDLEKLLNEAEATGVKGCFFTLERILNLREDPDFVITMKLANRAIEEYNEKQTMYVFKYKVLKIEKANYMISGYEQYLMTVKVLNLTLVTPIKTFYIHVARRIPDRFEEILSCNPKGVEPDVSVFGKKKCWRVVRCSV
ncbi:hypothetical protein R3W88_030911 [Solanum pinnatisectum]|uniref:Uncharacterized protein n=1 Tax=Solanum pinnatisectum TaxID=50273 RepID=A0AAV9LJX5_9SOLN|nr:hypothetical protein R3W88_030911 [Solanum pinnatisectum]